MHVQNVLSRARARARAHARNGGRARRRTNALLSQASQKGDGLFREEDRARARARTKRRNGRAYWNRTARGGGFRMTMTE